MGIFIYLAEIFKMVGELLTHASFWIMVLYVFVTVLLVSFFIKATRMLAYLSEMNSCAKNLEKWSAQNQFEYTEKHSPLRSAFGAFSGHDIELSRENEKYLIKFFKFVPKNLAMFIENDNRASASVMFAFTMHNKWANPLDITYSPIYSYKTKLDMTFEICEETENSQNIMIIPKNATNIAFSADNKKTLADSGVSYGGKFIFYNSVKIIDFLDRKLNRN